MSLGEKILEVCLELMGMELKQEPPKKQKRPAASPSRNPNVQQRRQAASAATEMNVGRGREQSDQQWMSLAEQAEARRSLVAVEEPGDSRPAGRQAQAFVPSARPDPAAVAKWIGAEQNRRAGGGAPAAELAARLRNDPAAAREAFIFAEVFGTPVGERQMRQ